MAIIELIFFRFYDIIITRMYKSMQITSRYVCTSFVNSPNSAIEKLQREINETPFSQRKIQKGGDCEVLEMAIAIYFH